MQFERNRTTTRIPFRKRMSVHWHTYPLYLPIGVTLYITRYICGDRGEGLWWRAEDAIARQCFIGVCGKAGAPDRFSEWVRLGLLLHRSTLISESVYIKT